MAFNQTYSDLLAKLPASLINEAWIRLTSRKCKPLSEKEASEINPIVELFLKHEAIRYQKRLMCQKRTQSWPECLTSFKKIPFIFISDNDTQTDNITWLEVLKTFEKFMRDVNLEYNEWINANKKMRYEIEDLKMQVQEAEKELASMKSDSTRPALKEYPNLV
ncbi:hypothetical protein C1646_765275 [Rhizophagus diaphanus]|nr:hypothetical protein C1646_765275 [Rhizophagus diaphanus] [Rhizophagus sp. MUCL 43196]